MELLPQFALHISGCFPPLMHRFLAANPQANPQIFRAFSASFAHRIVRALFRSLCAAISQLLADCAGKKNGENEAKPIVLRKNVRR